MRQSPAGVQLKKRMVFAGCNAALQNLCNWCDLWDWEYHIRRRRRGDMAWLFKVYN